MRTAFENGNVTEMEYKNHLVTMNKLKCFVIRNISTGFLVLETSSIQDINWVRNYIDKIQ